MSESLHPEEGETARNPEDLAEAGVYATVGEGFDHGLVVLAMGLSYWLFPSDAGFRLLVEPRDLEDVRAQLECFDRESANWPPLPAVSNTPPQKTAYGIPLLWAATLSLVYDSQLRQPGFLEHLGAMDSQGLFDRGEFWRPFTALFLHADVGHLLSNALSGIFVFQVLLSLFGRARGVALLTLASVVGNIAVGAMNYPGPYRSLGASTAVFAGLGLLTGRSLFQAQSSRQTKQWAAVLEPLAAGLALLGLFGAGGLQTDIGAHLTGFASGLVLGFLAARKASDVRKETVKVSL